MSALVAYRNWSDGVGTIPAWTFGYSLGYPDSLQEVAGYPATNLRTRQLGNVARFERVGGGAVTGPCAIELVASGAGFPVRLVTVIGQHLPDAVLYKPPGGSFASVALISGYSPLLGIASQGFAVVPPGTIVERVRLFWNDIPFDYFELSRVSIADALDLTDGVNSTWSLGVEDPGILDASAGRQWYSSPLPRTRRLSVAASTLDTMQAFGMSAEGVVSGSHPVPSIQDLQMHAGSTGEIVVVPRVAPGVWAYRAGVYGHLDRPPVIRHRAGPYYETDLTVIEER